MASNFPTARENPRADVQTLKQFARVINNIMRGKTNNTGSFTVAASAASTEVAHPFIGGDSVILFMPTTANAATEYAAGGMYVSSVGDGTFTVQHANNAQTDRDFNFVIIG